MVCSSGMAGCVWSKIPFFNRMILLMAICLLIKIVIQRYDKVLILVGFI